MWKSLSRVIGTRGAAPVPGQDAPDAPWREAMHPGEFIVFYYDREGRSINPTGQKAQSEMLEIAVAFQSRFAARLMMRGARQRYDGVTVAMYDKRGRWLETRSNAGIRHRNEALEYAKYVLQFPLVVAGGIVFLIALIALRAKFLGGLPLDWGGMTPSDRGAIVFSGALLGFIARVAWFYFRLKAIKSAISPALSPLGSEKREEFYQQLAKRKSDSLTPLEPELEATEIPWPDYPQHDAWAKEYQRLGFKYVGSFRVLKTPSYIEFYVHEEKNISGSITYGTMLNVGMYIDMTTGYEDGLVFSVAAKESPGLDPHPKRKTIRLTREASVEDVFQKMVSERPDGAMLTMTRELVVPRFKQRWREYVEWRRARGTTAEEYKRIDERRAARKRGEQV